MGYLELEPPEKERWLQAARISLTVAQAAGSKKAKLEHFMPSFETKPKEQNPLEQLAVIASMTDIPEHIQERFEKWQSKARRRST